MLGLVGGQPLPDKIARRFKEVGHGVASYRFTTPQSLLILCLQSPTTTQ